MIAWTSPLPTARSMPDRISCSGWPRGATRRPPMTSWRSVPFVPFDESVTCRPCWWSGGGGDSERHEVGQGQLVEGPRDRVADADPQDVDRAPRRPVAQHRVLGIVAGADHRGDRALECAEGLAHRDLGRRSGQLVAALSAPGADDEAGLAEVAGEMLEVRPRQVLLGG